MPNILSIVATDNGKTFPLRGDMACELDFTPDEQFKIAFVTQDTELFPITSALHDFRAFDATAQEGLEIGGKIGLFIELMFDVDNEEFVVTQSNVVSGETSESPGTGASFLETVVTPDSNGNVQLNVSGGYNYVLTLNKNTTLLNPTGFTEGDILDIVVKQDATGNRVLSYGTRIAVPNALPPSVNAAPNAIDRLILRYTAGNLWLLTPQFLNYSLVLPFARIGGTLFYKMGGPEAQGAMNLVAAGQTIVVTRNGKGAEVTGTIVGTANSVYTIAGAPISDGSGDPRPELKLFATDRPAYGKALLNLEIAGKTFLRDLRLTGARNSDGDARGISIATAHEVVVQNVQVTDCNNGILSGNADHVADITISDSLFSANGVGTANSQPNQNYNSSGFVHNLYTGDNERTVTVSRSSFVDSISGHNFKTRTATNVLNQVLCKRAFKGRELNIPIGAKFYATNCHFWKTTDASSQGNLVGIGEEGIKTTRTREYVFTNCRFQIDIIEGGRDLTFLISFDQQVAMRFIDCEFVGSSALALQSDPNNNSAYTGMVTVNGIRYYPAVPPVFEYTNGPLGPILPVGYVPVAMTAVA